MSCFKVFIGNSDIGGFSEIKGLDMETEMEEYREGGVNDHVHSFFKATKFPRLVLKYGVMDSSILWKWYESYTNGTETKLDGSIVLYNQAGDVICTWSFVQAFPVKWVGPELKAMSGDVAIETLELIHGGLTVKFSK
jgi:phage tail-like protein